MTPSRPHTLTIQRFLCQHLWPPVKRKQMHGKVARYLARETVEPLGHDPNIKPELERIPTGRNSSVYRWNHPERGMLIVRAWPYDLTVRPARRHEEGGTILQHAGLRIPKIFVADFSMRTLKRYRIEIVVESSAPGLQFNRRAPFPPELLDWYANTLATLHKKTSSEWGKPWLPVNEMAEPRAYWLQRIEKFRHRIKDGYLLLSHEKVQQLLEQVTSGVEQFTFEAPVLVHGDLNPGNLILDDAGEVTWIDFETVHFGLVYEDLISVQRWLGPLGQFDDFMELYVAAGGVRLEEHKSGYVLFAKLLLLEKLRSRISHLGRDRVGKKSPAVLREEQYQYETWLGELLEHEDPACLSHKRAKAE